MQNPSLTVLMTVYNGLPYLKEAVRSILRQDMKDFDLHILDNGSRDGSAEWLDALAAQHGQALPRLSVERLPENIGRTAALNMALGRVGTELTALLDADDIAAPQRLSRQMAFFRDNPEVDLLGSDITYIDGAGTVTGERNYPTDHASLCRLLPVDVQFSRSACAFRTRAALAAGGYDMRFPHAQDLALWIAMLQHGSRAASIPEPLASVREHPGQSSRGLALLMVRAEDTHRLMAAILAIPGLDKTARQLAQWRGGAALWRLGRKREALARVWQGFLEAPFASMFNPLLWRRVQLKRERRSVGNALH